MDAHEQETVLLSFRTANLFGGNIADACFGKRHCSVKTSRCETGQGKIGAGVPGQGAEGCACTLYTEMVDHSGQSGSPEAINVTVTVNKCCFLNAIKPNRHKGLWTPLINDCNTVMQEAVESCGGDWDSAYANYMGQNKVSSDYWRKVNERYRACERFGWAY